MKGERPGKYDAECTAARKSTKALGVILAVIEGKDGSGFSVQLPLGMVPMLPALLRDMANEIEEDIKKGDGT